MFNIVVITECGEFRCQVKTMYGIPAGINDVLEMMRRNLCEHNIISIIVTRNPGSYNKIIKYWGSCSFGN